MWGGASANVNDYVSKSDQLAANAGWCFTANNAIAEPTAAVPLKLYKKLKDGKREEILDHEILELLHSPNAAHTGEQMRLLHFTYMNFVGESYIYMRDLRGNDFEPRKGQLPAALEIFPAHLVQFKLEEQFSRSTVRYGGDEHPISSIIRDLNPDPARPYYGRSIIRAAAVSVDLDSQMKQWNRGVFARGGRPSMIVQVNEEMGDKAFARFKAQIDDQFGGTDNAFRPLVVEGDGKVVPYMMNAQDLDFLASRKFSMTEILSMWRVSPGLLGQMESANRASLDAIQVDHARNNIRPRIRQFVNQLNATLVQVYDPTLELSFEDPVPEDTDAKLKAAQAGVDKWWTKDEVRDQYGDKPLPDGLGGQIYMANNNAPLSTIAEPPKPPVKPVTAPASEDGEELDPDVKDDEKAQKSLIRKRRNKMEDVICVSCRCCDAIGEHYETGFECYRCDAAGWCTPDEDKTPIPCGGRKDSPEVWVDDEGRYRHTEERRSLVGVKKKT